MWSTTFSVGKIALEVSPPLFLTGVRMLIAGVILLSYLFFVRRQDIKITKQQLFPLILLAIFAIYLTNALEFWGLQYLTAAKACLIYSLSPFLSCLFSYFVFKEKITKSKILGLLIGFLGIIPVLMTQDGSDMLGLFGFLSWAEIALICATAFAVYGWILLRKLGKDLEMNPLMANGSSMLLGGLLALIHSSLTENWSPFPVSDWGTFMGSIGLMIIFSNLICYNLYGYLLKKFTATFLSFAGLTTPIFAAFFGWLLLGEGVSWEFALSIGVISIGLWMVYFEELKLGYFSHSKKDAK